MENFNFPSGFNQDSDSDSLDAHYSKNSLFNNSPSLGAAAPFNFTRSYTEPDVVLNIKEVKELKHLLKLGAYTKRARKEIDSSSSAAASFNQTFLDSLEKHQIAAICLLVPVQLAPHQMYDTIFSILSDMPTFPRKVQTGIYMRMVKAATLSGKGQELYDLKILQNAFNEDKELFAAPLLFLTASLNYPITIEYEYSGIVRVNAETIYYLALNKLLLKDFEGAERDLLRALILSKKVKDMKTSIFEKLALASFLNKTPYEVYFKRIPINKRPTGFIADMWNLDKKLKLEFIPSFFTRFKTEIVKEKCRRVLIDIASSTLEINYSKLCEICNCTYVDEIINELQESNLLFYERNEDNVIKFDNPSRAELIEKELVNIDEVMGVLKAI